MQFFTTISLLLAVTTLVSGTTNIRTFQEFKKHFGKQYESPEIEALKESNFAASLKRFDALKLENPTVEFGINEYSDLVSDLPVLYL